MMKQLSPLLKVLDENYAKAPALPKKWTDLIVTFAPWLALLGGVLGLLFGVMGLLASLSLFGLVAAVAPLGVYGATYGPQYIIAVVVGALVLLATGVLSLMAYPSLKARKEKGWNLMFFVLVLGIVSSIASLNVFSIVMSLVVALIEYYVLYQVKAYYK
ncbi:MAG TPA: hypothetical protein VMR77_00305 [Patescibacteria group bacterium]|jgi:hypothetical protein|nr:hypothetical protein [Patescibacteria group bacterium]